MADNVTGGCFCGAIRYTASGEPVLQLICYCKDCLATCGTAGYAGYMVKEKDFSVTKGKPISHTRSGQKGRSVHRHFCGECGSNLFGVTELGLISVAAGSLDNPAIFQPTKKVFVSDAPHWANIPEYLEEME